MRTQGKLFDPSLLDEIRERFCHVGSDPFSGERVYLENAGGGATLCSVIEVAQRVAALPDNAGRRNAASQEIGRVIQAGLEDAALFLGANGGAVMSGESTTGNVFRILDAVTQNLPGNNIVCTNLDHPSSWDATRFFAERHSLDWRAAQLDPATCRVPVEAVSALADERTVAVVFIHASNITGTRHDAAAIARAVRRRAPQAIVIADGAQHAQHGVIDVNAMGVDAYLFSAYKAFSKAGLTFAWLGGRVASLPHPKLRGKPDDCWELGTRDASGYAAFSAVVDYLCWLAGRCGSSPESRRQGICDAMHAIEAHETALTDRLLNGSERAPGLLGMDRIALYGEPAASDRREAVFAFNITGLDAGEAVERYGEDGIVVHDRQRDAYSGHTLAAMGVTSCIRVSLAHYNTIDEVDAFLEVTRRLARISGKGKRRTP